MCTKRMWLAMAAAAAIAVVVTPGPGVLASFAVMAACPLMMLMMAAGLSRFGRHGAPTGGDEANEVTRLRAELAELQERAGR